MKMEKQKIGDGTAWVKKLDYEWEGKEYEADIKDGDKVTILDEGTKEPQDEKFGGGERDVFKIKTRNGEKKFAPNPKSINILIDRYGEDSSEWIGKEVDVVAVKTVIAGKKVVVAYLTDGNWELDDFGDLVLKEGIDNPFEPTSEIEGQTEDGDNVQYPSDDPRS